MRVRSFALALLLVASAAGARIISYSPYSDRISYPATQHRMNRFFAIVEVVPVSQVGLSPVFFSYPTGQLVYHRGRGRNGENADHDREHRAAHWYEHRRIARARPPNTEWNALNRRSKRRRNRHRRRYNRVSRGRVDHS